MQGTNEYMSEEEIATEKVGRSIGLAMIPGRHIQKMEIRPTVRSNIQPISAGSAVLIRSMTTVCTDSL